MTDRTRIATFRLIYIAPTLTLQALRVVRQAPDVGDPPLVVVVVLGSFILSLLVGAVLLPRVLKSLGRQQLASQWRRAAFCGLDYPALWIPLWTGIYVQAWPLGAQLLVSVAVSLAGFSSLSWVDRRWLHYGILKWR